jgi:hypothetical protein
MAVSGYVGGQLIQITSNIEGVPNIFFYNDTALTTGATSGDSITTIQGTNYFSDGQKRGLALGSIVFVVTDYVATPAPVTHVCYVSAVQATSSGYGATVTLCPGST